MSTSNNNSNTLDKEFFRSGRRNKGQPSAAGRRYSGLQRLRWMLLVVLPFLVVVVNSSQTTDMPRLLCGEDEPCSTEPGMSCEEMIGHYRFRGSCCSLENVPGGCRVHGNNCSWVPWCGGETPCGGEDEDNKNKTETDGSGCGSSTAAERLPCPEGDLDPLAIQAAEDFAVPVCPPPMEAQASVLSSEAENKPTWDDALQQIYFCGRWWREGDAMKHSWGIGRFVIRFRGSSSLVVKMGAAEGGAYFTCRIDNGPETRLLVANTQQEATASGLVFSGLSPQEEHFIECGRNNEASYGDTIVTGIELDGGGQLLEAKDPNADNTMLRFEAIGDSITAGYKVTNPPSSPIQGTIENQDVFRSYVRHMADAWGTSDYQVIATTGVFTLGHGPVMPEEWPCRGYWQRSEGACPVPWDFGNWQADVVTINLGTNELLWADPAEGQFRREYLAFLRQVRSKYPNALIACIGLVQNSCAGESWCDNLARLTEIVTGLEQAVHDMDDPKVLYYETGTTSDPWLDCTLTTQDFVDFVHPSVQGHEKLAEKLLETMTEDVRRFFPVKCRGEGPRCGDTKAPTTTPTTFPTTSPTTIPTPYPTTSPTTSPTPHPTANPTTSPTPNPTYTTTEHANPKNTESPTVDDISQGGVLACTSISSGTRCEKNESCQWNWWGKCEAKAGTTANTEPTNSPTAAAVATISEEVSPRTLSNHATDIVAFVAIGCLVWCCWFSSRSSNKHLRTAKESTFEMATGGGFRDQPDKTENSTVVTNSSYQFRDEPEFEGEYL